MLRIVRHHWLPFAAALVGVSAAIALQLLPRDPLPPWLRLALTIASVGLAAVPGLYSFLRAEERAQSSEISRERREALDDLEQDLIAAITRLLPKEDLSRIRANVMVVREDRLHILAGANMRLYPDHDLTLGYDQGSAGVAWKRAIEAPMNECWRPLFAPNAQLTPAELRTRWSLDPEQIGRTRHVLWILSIPLFFKSRSGRAFLGILNFDGVNTPLERPGRLQERSFWGTAVTLAERIAEILVQDRLVPTPSP
jgi:hypothetical protein